MEKKINIGQNGKVVIVWNTKPAEATKEMENCIITAFAKKYGIPESNVTIEKNTIVATQDGEISLNEENIKDIHDTKFQQELMKQYIAENGIEDYDIDEIFKIDSQINSLINYDNYEKSKRYSIKWINWSNFLSYGQDNHFDFTQLNGLVLLNGQPANKSGKSTFAYDLLHFLLFGETKSGKAKNLGGLFNNYLPNETELYVEGCITIDGQDYVIKRTLTRPAKSKKAVRTASQKIEYYKVYPNGERTELEDVDNLQEKSSTETNKVIKEAIGNESDFDLIISANAKDLDDLISLKEDARGKLLSRWIGLSVLEDKDALARQKWNKEISVGRFCDIYNRETLKVEIAEMEEENNGLRESISKNKELMQECQSRIDGYNKDKEVLLSQKRPVDEGLEKVGDVTTLEAKLASIAEEGTRKKAEVDEFKKKLAEFGDIEYSEEEYKKLQKEKDEIISKQAYLKSQYEILKKANADLASAEYCPFCKRKLDNVDNSGLIAENEAKIQEIIKSGNALKTRKEEIVSLLVDIDNKRNLYKEKNKIELRIAALNTDVVSLRSDYNDTKVIIKQLNDNKDAIQKNGEIDAEINSKNASIRLEEGLRDKASNENVLYIANGKKNKELIGEKKGIIEKIEKEQKIEKDWKLYLKMIGKDGISKMVLGKALPIINSELNRLLNNATDFEVEVCLNEKNDVDFWLVRDGVKTMLSASSGLERTQSALALRVVLGNMSRLSKPNFLLLDEILGTVSKEFYDDMKKLYDKIVANYTFIFHICHIDLDWHDMIVTVIKEGNISRVKSIETN